VTGIHIAWILCKAYTFSETRVLVTAIYDGTL